MRTASPRSALLLAGLLTSGCHRSTTLSEPTDAGGSFLERCIATEGPPDRAELALPAGEAVVAYTRTPEQVVQDIRWFRGHDFVDVADADGAPSLETRAGGFALEVVGPHALLMRPGSCGVVRLESPTSRSCAAWTAEATALAVDAPSRAFVLSPYQVYEVTETGATTVARTSSMPMLASPYASLSCQAGACSVGGSNGANVLDLATRTRTAEFRSPAVIASVSLAAEGLYAVSRERVFARSMRPAGSLELLATLDACPDGEPPIRLHRAGATTYGYSMHRIVATEGAAVRSVLELPCEGDETIMDVSDDGTRAYALLRTTRRGCSGLVIRAIDE